LDLSNTPPLQKPDLGFEVRKNFVNQFAENQNHHQSLFIQFLSVVIIAVIAYGYVYINTANYPFQETLKKTESIVSVSMSKQFTRAIFSITETGQISIPLFNINNLENTAYPDSAILKPIDSRTFDAVKDKEGKILSYSKTHVTGAYLIAQLVLVILALTLLNMGYSYRRDQFAVYQIRKEALGGEEEFKRIFPIGFTGLKKRFNNYLPNFYAILFIAIFFIQLILFCSIYIFFNRYHETIFVDGNELQTVFLRNIFFNYDINYRALKLLLSTPVLLSFSFYFLYFGKYNRRVNKTKLTTQLMIMYVATPLLLRRMALICFGSTIIMALIMWVWKQPSAALISAAIINFFVTISQVWLGKLSAKSDEGKSIVNGILFLICGAAIFLIVILAFIYHSLHVQIRSSELFLSCLTLTILLYIVSRIVQERVGSELEQRALIMHQLRQQSYSFLSLTIFYGLIYFSHITFLDYVLAFLLGASCWYSSINSFNYVMNSEIEGSEKNHNGY
jgi:hypothetical protein